MPESLIYMITMLLLAVFFSLVIRRSGRSQSVGGQWRSYRRSKLPPGPSGPPVVGNLLQFWRARSTGPLDSYLLSFRTFGEMTTLRLGSRTWVFLNTERVADELISKRSRVTSERPYMPVSSGLISNAKRSVLQMTASWMETRRMMRPLLTTPLVQAFTPWLHRASAQLLRSYLDTPPEWYLHHAQYATSILYGLIGGGHLAKTDDEMDEYRRVTIEFLMSLYNNWIDFFPSLDRLPSPLQFWRHRWGMVGDSHRHVFRSWWEPIKAGVTQRVAGASWARDVLFNPEMAFGGSEDDALYLTNSLISAGGDNVRMTLNVFVMACLAFPDVMRRAREEVDAVCGSRAERLPGVDDIASMPYVCALVKEILRWRPVVPFIIPHALSEDLEFEGFTFPRGTCFVINTVAICAAFDDPDVLCPERWSDGNETRLSHGFWGFGGGRRICIGYKVVQPALFLTMSRLIYCFDFESRGPYDTRKLNHWVPTEPFPVRVTKRSLAHEQLILSQDDSPN